MKQIEELIPELAKAIIECKPKIRLTTVYAMLAREVRDKAPKSYHARHHKGCTKQMRENARLRAKEQVRKSYNSIPETAVGLTVERVRELTKQK